MLTDAKRDSRNQVAAKAMLQSVEDFFAPIPYYFVEPRAAVDAHEQCAFAYPGWLRVGHYQWVEELVPDFHDLSLALPAIDSQFSQNPWQDRAGGRGSQSPGFFQRRDVHTTPLGQDTLPAGFATGSEGRNKLWWRS